MPVCIHTARARDHSSTIHKKTVMSLTRILITPGEPAGIGPEIVVKALQKAHPYAICVICDPTLLENAAQALEVPLKLKCISEDQCRSVPLPPLPEGSAYCLPVPLQAPVEAGTLAAANASYVLRTLKLANDLCLENYFHAVVTGPVQKSIINEAGISFSGHTEFFAEHSHTDRVVMMLASDEMRVALATTHLPLKDVSDNITQASLSTTLGILIKDLQQKFGIHKPRILVCGLNPHAGENGHMGREEIDVITPVLKQMRSLGATLIGPLPADTLFTHQYLKECDAVLAMYHDQGLPVLKYQSFGKAINITLGLPYIRTSVDHGTALGIAGKGIADEGSLIEALTQAYQLARTAE